MFRDTTCANTGRRINESGLGYGSWPLKLIELTFVLAFPTLSSVKRTQSFGLGHYYTQAEACRNGR
jgi:hypothetical protein